MPPSSPAHPSRPLSASEIAAGASFSTIVLLMNCSYHTDRFATIFGTMSTDRKQIIMNFSFPPSTDDLGVIANDVLSALPEELSELCEELELAVDEIADEMIVSELDLDDSFELVALFRSGKEISPGVQKKVANGKDTLILFRRPLLDMWCETGEDLNALVRQVMIEELGRNLEFSDDDIAEMTERHYQGML